MHFFWVLNGNMIRECHAAFQTKCCVAKLNEKSEMRQRSQRFPCSGHYSSMGKNFSSHEILKKEHFAVSMALFGRLSLGLAYSVYSTFSVQLPVVFFTGQPSCSGWVLHPTRIQWASRFELIYKYRIYMHTSVIRLRIENFRA